MSKLLCRDPATGEIHKELVMTPIDELPKIFDRAKAAQLHWASLSPKKRAQYLLQLREVVLNEVESLEETLHKETGKPRFEALSNEILPCVEVLTYFAKQAPSVLKTQRLPLRLMKHRRSELQYWPLGTVAVISPWNYPLLLPFAQIAMALVSGNAVLHKPSEVTPLTGLKIQELCDEAGFPPHLIQTLIGDGTLGAALIENKPDKIFFTGSVPTGKKIMQAAANHLIPVNLELGGKDPMIILPDADLDFASSIALWGSFSNAGQTCASTERILVHEKIAKPFLQKLSEKAASLRKSDELGPITFEKQREVLQRQLAEAREKGAEFVCGGEISSDGRYLTPTVVTGPNVEELELYNEESFGNVVAVTTFRSVAEAVHKANKSKYGLSASVITKDFLLGEQVARQLECGTVTINETTYTAGLPETPWGGLKQSGMGRTHSAAGLHEFVNIRHVHRPRSRLFVFKSWWWFPYTSHQFQVFRTLLGLYRRHTTDKLKAFPHFLWNLAQFLKNERRL